MLWELSDRGNVVLQILNTTDDVIMNITNNGNMGLAGTLHESESEPPNVVFVVDDKFWLTESGHLYISGTETTVSNPSWIIMNTTDVIIFRYDNGNIQIHGTIYENI